ncbi:MAG TPA: hypothetical protein DCQ97_01485 [Chitinophagaceae bacterium]|nr:hypothetical protein [Chitinophagaceae bacterium]
MAHLVQEIKIQNHLSFSSLLPVILPRGDDERFINPIPQSILHNHQLTGKPCAGRNAFLSLPCK